MHKPKVSKTLLELSSIFYSTSPLFIVGGCVRDAFLNRKNYDIDITSAISVTDVENLLKETKFKLKLINKKLGTVKIYTENESFEYTAFRKENYEKFGYHLPKEIIFNVSQYEDCLRRDFTINSLYYDIENDRIIDYLGAKSDFEAKIIRTTRNPEIVFQEDSLRIFRLIRQSVELDFGIENETYKCAKNMAKNCKNLSTERITDELVKLLNNIRIFDKIKYEKFIDFCLDMNLQNVIFNYETKISDKKPQLEIEDLPKEFLMAYFVLVFIEKSYINLKNFIILKFNKLIDVEFNLIEIENFSKECNNEVFKFLSQLTLSKKDKKIIADFVVLVFICEKKLLKNAKNYSNNKYLRLFIVQYCDIINILLKFEKSNKANYNLFHFLFQYFEFININNIPTNLKELKLKGNDLTLLDIENCKRSKALKLMLNDTILGKVENEKSKQISYLNIMREKWLL